MSFWDYCANKILKDLPQESHDGILEVKNYQELVEYLLKNRCGQSLLTIEQYKYIEFENGLLSTLYQKVEGKKKESE